MTDMIQAKKLHYEYKRYNEEGNVENICTALDSVDLNVKKGEFIVILGHNGSGKSTLAKHINAILCPDSGTITLNGMDVTDAGNLWEVRRMAGMVFQNPDNQIIASVVEEDVAFGPENLGVPTSEIWDRVEQSLEAVNMSAYRNHSPNNLSGGQKQRVAIAGVMAMESECIIMDEPTAMLDPVGRKEILEAARRLNQEKGITIILITHYMEEAADADYIYVMDHGSVVMEGAVREIFSRAAELKQHRMELPYMTELAHRLREAGADIPEGILRREELTDALVKAYAPRSKQEMPSLTSEPASRKKRWADESANRAAAPILTLEQVRHVYNAGTVSETVALDQVNLEIYQGEFIGVIGHTGSGKTTLIQHLNGLIAPTSGVIRWKGQDIHEKGFSLRELRSHVGLVFQYPEHQLFGETVLEDVCFGPRNLGQSEEQARASAIAALEAVGLEEAFFRMSPFDLSGGQKRRAAIAGVLAMQTEILILDEPTAGLDPKGRDEILSMIEALRESRHITIILVSHSMEDVAAYADRLIVMQNGSMVCADAPETVFAQIEKLEEMGLAAPDVTYLMRDLKTAGYDVDDTLITLEEAVEEIKRKCCAI